MTKLLLRVAFNLLHPNRGRFLLVITLSATIQLDHWQSCSDLLRVDLVVCELSQLVKALSVKINEHQKEWANLDKRCNKNHHNFLIIKFVSD